jgi:protein SCO1/2
MDMNMDMKDMDMKDMNMDHSSHDHAMNHSEHEHHMMTKPGLLSKSMGEYSVPHVQMVGMKGENVALNKTLNADSPIILNFIFTSCTTICPVQSATFKHVQKQLGDAHSDLKLISISIDPENDTPAKLREYATRFGTGPQWKLLTGSLENTIAIQKAFAVYAGDKMDQKPVTFIKAKGSDNMWLRLEGLVDASQIIKEFNELTAK